MSEKKKKDNNLMNLLPDDLKMQVLERIQLKRVVYLDTGRNETN